MSVHIVGLARQTRIDRDKVLKSGSNCVIMIEEGSSVAIPMQVPSGMPVESKPD
jgi:hypothetical protein